VLIGQCLLHWWDQVEFCKRLQESSFWVIAIG
jgi:hypothetical protein